MDPQENQTPITPPQPTPIPQQPAPAVTPQPPNIQNLPPAPLQTTTPDQPPQANSPSPLDNMHRHDSLISKVVAGVAILSICINFYMIMHVLNVRKDNYSKLPQVQREIAQANFTDPVVDRPDGTLNVSQAVDAKAMQSQDLKAKLNQQINFSNGYSFMFTGYEMDWKPQARGTALADGYSYLKLDAVAGNRTGEKMTSNSILLFLTGKIRTVDENGKPSKTFAKTFFCTTCVGNSPFGERSDLSDTFGIASLDSGESISGSFAVQVPSGTVPKLILERDEFVFTSSKGEDITMKVEVTLE